ncbi:MAG: 2-hydroxyacid dehydrogenase [Acidimicrobiia bacterium]|nr:2-hydroxyacid dehydrogenase [Acidimicrobiia bacterium]
MARIAVFSTKPYDRAFLAEANATHGHDLTFLEVRLDAHTALLAEGHDVVCPFVNDDVSAATVDVLAGLGVRHLALRSAGFNHVDLDAVEAAGMVVSRVPAYSPHAVAEHAVALILALNRKVHRAWNRVREGNFAIDGLMGFDLVGRTVGVVGSGQIGRAFAEIMQGFSCEVLAHDPYPSDGFPGEFVGLDELFKRSDIISLHCPLTPETHHIVGPGSLAQMKDGVMLINTSRGALVNAPAVIEALKSGKVGALGLDVYEEEGDLFFEDLSATVIQDDTFSRLLTFPNVLITGHQAFFTREAVGNICATTLANVTAWEAGEGDLHLVPR